MKKIDKVIITSDNIWQIASALDLVIQMGGDDNGILTEQGREKRKKLRDLFFELSHPSDEDYLFEITRGEQIEKK